MSPAAIVIPSILITAWLVWYFQDEVNQFFNYLHRGPRRRKWKSPMEQANADCRCRHKALVRMYHDKRDINPACPVHGLASGVTE